MYKRKAIYQNSHIIPVIMLCSLWPSCHILIDYLQIIIVDILLINQGNVFCQCIIPFQYLDIIFLYLSGLLYNALILVGNARLEKPFPLRIREPVIIQYLQPFPQIVNQILLLVYLQILIPLFGKHTDKFFL